MIAHRGSRPRLHFFGAAPPGEQQLGDLLVFDVEASAFRTVDSSKGAPEPRSRHTLNVVDETLYCALGYRGEGAASHDIFTLPLAGGELGALLRAAP